MGIQRNPVLGNIFVDHIQFKFGIFDITLGSAFKLFEIFLATIKVI